MVDVYLVPILVVNWNTKANLFRQKIGLYREPALDEITQFVIRIPQGILYQVNMGYTQRCS